MQRAWHPQANLWGPARRGNSASMIKVHYSGMDSPFAPQRLCDPQADVPHYLDRIRTVGFGRWSMWPWGVKTDPGARNGWWAGSFAFAAQRRDSN